MNPTSLAAGAPPDVSLQPEWQHQVEAWRELIAQCARKPSRKRVHALRRLTLRLRAAMEHELQGQARGSAAARAVKRWEKAGKKLRRALGPVRDADVYMARLDGLRNPVGGATGGKPDLSPRCLREIDKLEARLEAERQSGAEELMAVLAAQSKRLNRRSLEMEETLSSGMGAKTRSTAQAALETFAELTGEFPALDATNLHAYRKRLKQALYLAEISAAADPLAKRLAAAFRRFIWPPASGTIGRRWLGRLRTPFPPTASRTVWPRCWRRWLRGSEKGSWPLPPHRRAVPDQRRRDSAFGKVKTFWSETVRPPGCKHLSRRAIKKPHENSVSRGRPTAYSRFVIPGCAAEGRRIRLVNEFGQARRGGIGHDSQRTARRQA